MTPIVFSLTDTAERIFEELIIEFKYSDPKLLFPMIMAVVYKIIKLSLNSLSSESGLEEALQSIDNMIKSLQWSEKQMSSVEKFIEEFMAHDPLIKKENI